MKKLTICILILTLVLSSTLSFAYAKSVANEPGVFEKVGDVIGTTAGNVIKSVSEMVGKTLDDLIDYVTSKFKDVKQSDWYINTVSKLVGIGGIDGYPDGTFRPNDTITKAEFTKLLVSSMGYDDVNKTGTHWASGYIDKAEEIGLIDNNEFKDKLDTTISRNEMAKMCANALDHLGESQDSNRNTYKSQIKDFNKIPSKYQDYVLKTYSKGIITGYTDGTFKGDKGLTRAEASTVVIRVIDKNERENIGVSNGDFIEPEFKVELTTDEKYTFNYFEIILTNYQEYVDKDYTFTTVCISHPELNKRLVEHWREDRWFVSDYTGNMTSSRLLSQVPKGKIYELTDFEYDLNPETNKPFKLKNGEKLKYEVTVTNGKSSKTYEVEVAFKDKEF